MKFTVEYFRPGQEISAEAGDVFLTSSERWLSKAIRFSQRLRYKKEFAFWNHAGIALGVDATLESLWYGPQKNTLLDYTDSYVVVIHPKYHPHDLAQVLDFCEYLLETEWSYGYFEVVSLLVQLITGTRLGVSSSTSRICSALVCDALRPANAKFKKNSAFMMPADLADYFMLGFK